MRLSGLKFLRRRLAIGVPVTAAYLLLWHAPIPHFSSLPVPLHLALDLAAAMLLATGLILPALIVQARQKVTQLPLPEITLLAFLPFALFTLAVPGFHPGDLGWQSGALLVLSWGLSAALLGSPLLDRFTMRPMDAISTRCHLPVGLDLAFRAAVPLCGHEADYMLPGTLFLLEEAPEDGATGTEEGDSWLMELHRQSWAVSQTFRLTRREQVGRRYIRLDFQPLGARGLGRKMRGDMAYTFAPQRDGSTMLQFELRLRAAPMRMWLVWWLSDFGGYFSATMAAQARRHVRRRAAELGMAPVGGAAASAGDIAPEAPKDGTLPPHPSHAA